MLTCRAILSPVALIQASFPDMCSAVDSLRAEGEQNTQPRSVLHRYLSHRRPSLLATPLWYGKSNIARTWHGAVQPWRSFEQHEGG